MQIELSALHYSMGDPHSYDYKSFDNVTVSSDNIAIRDIESDNSNGLIIVGANGNIWQSSDKGLSWDNRTSGTTNSLCGKLTYGDSIFVVVGGSGTILTSSDGITWTSRTSPAGTSKSLFRFAFTE